MLKYVLTFFLFRIYGLFFSPINPDSLVDWLVLSRGFFSDIFLAVCFWAVLDKFIKSESLRLVAVALLIVICGINLEHILVNGSNLNFDFLKYGTSQEFILGSIFSLKNIPVLGFCFAIAALSWFLIRNARQRCLEGKVVLLIALIAVLGSFWIPLQVGFSYWTQMNFMEENSRSLFKKLSVDSALSQHPENVWDVRDGTLVRRAGSPELMKTFFGQDLLGQEIIKVPPSLNNILIVLVEGLSYALLEQGKLPFLSKLRDEGLFFSNFVSLQRQTNRGMYAVLCGDYPNYLDQTAKMDLFGQLDTGQECLPAILKKKGYHSVFMQSNNLNFMSKGRFARVAGFDEYYGDRSFKDAIARSNWGVDDRTLYRNALEKIETLAYEKFPWMLTLLTVGTHHPYLVPDIPLPTTQQVLKYTDDTLREFIEELGNRGHLKNTLVVITSDEAAFVSGKTEFERELSQHHAPLIVLGGPVTKPEVQSNYFTQADLLLSFADFLRVDLEGGQGRSIFRRYSEERALLFGNVYTSKLYSLSEDGDFYTCDQSLNCEAFSSTWNFFSKSPSIPIQGSHHFMELLKEAILYNDYTEEKVAAGKAALAVSLR